MENNILEWRSLVTKNSDEKIVFSIKNYQRFYEWDTKNIKLFLDSIIKKIYIGAASFSSDANIMEIIDGQQRLTTLLLIFGDYKSLIKFEFNLPKEINEMMNKIIKYENLKKNDIEIINKDNYLKKILNLKKIIKEELKNLFNSKKNNIKNIEDLLSNVFFPMIKVPNKNKISDIFRRINTTGIKIGISSIYKSLLIEKYPNSTEQINNDWYKAQKFFYKIKNRSISNPKFDDIFVQSFNSVNESTKWIGSSKRNFSDEIINFKKSSLLANYTVWAAKYLIYKTKNSNINVKEILSLNIYTLNGKIVPEILPIIFRISEKINNDENMWGIFLALAVYSNVYVSSNDINKKMFKTGCKEILKEINLGPNWKATYLTIIRNIYKISNSWTGDFKKEYISKIKFFYLSSNHKENLSDYTFRISAKNAKFAYLIKSILFLISHLRKKENEVSDESVENIVNERSWSEAELADILKNYDFKKLLSRKNMTIEHLFTNSNPQVIFLEMVESEFNSNELEDKNINEKFNIINNLKDNERKKVYNWGDFSSRNNLDILNKNKKGGI